jgi:hypothetical protein
MRNDCIIEGGRLFEDRLQEGLLMSSEPLLQVAAWFGSIKQELEYFDDEIKILVAGSIRSLSRIHQGQFNYQNVKMMFDNLPLATKVQKNRDQITSELNVILDDIRMSDSVHAWLKDQLGELILKSAGLSKKNLEKLLYYLNKKIKESELPIEKTDILDIGMICYPNIICSPDFLIYHLTLQAEKINSRDSKSYNVHLKVSCQYEKYGPNVEVIKGMKEEVRVKATKEFLDHFKSLEILRAENND